MLRMEEFYQATLLDDIMILTYRDRQTEEKFIAKRKKVYLPKTKWALTKDTNPYCKNRPRPPPRGNKTSGPVPPKQSHKTLPQLNRIVVHCMMKQALSNKQHLLSGIMALQCVTSERPVIVYSKSNVARWKLRKGMPIGCKVHISGASMYTFLDKLVEIVLPRIKEWSGISINTGDQNGNIAIGFPPEVLSLFPDIESNFDMFPMMTGFQVIFHTTAFTDFEGRILLSGFQIPFDPGRKIKKKKKKSS